MGLTLTALTAMLVVQYSGLLQDADASIRQSAEERRNNVLDKHIAAGGAHGERAQEIKDGDGGVGGGTGDEAPGEGNEPDGGGSPDDGGGVE